MRPHLSAFTTAVVCRPRSSPGWFECLAVGVCLPVGQRRSAGRCVVRERGRGPPQCPANVWGRACETRVNEWRVEGRVIGARSCLKICTRSRLPCTSARRHAQLCGQDSQLVLSSLAALRTPNNTMNLAGCVTTGAQHAAAAITTRAHRTASQAPWRRPTANTCRISDAIADTCTATTAGSVHTATVRYQDKPPHTQRHGAGSA